MKLPNWLHRKPAELDLGAWFDAHPGTFIAPDPYLDSLLGDKTEAVVPTLGPHPRIEDFAARTGGRWAKANETLFLAPPESVEGAHARGYWEGRAEATAESTTAAVREYRVEIIRTGPGYGGIDEVLLHDADRAILHLERLDTDHWWLTLSPTGGWDGEVLFDLFRVKKCIEVTEQ